MLSETHIIELQRMYKNRFGKSIGRQEAVKKGIALIQLMKLTYKRMTVEELAQLQERRKQTKNI